jgi:hypothetical protein
LKRVVFKGTCLLKLAASMMASYMSVLPLGIRSASELNIINPALVPKESGARSDFITTEE